MRRAIAHYNIHTIKVKVVATPTSCVLVISYGSRGSNKRSCLRGTGSLGATIEESCAFMRLKLIK